MKIALLCLFVFVLLLSGFVSMRKTRTVNDLDVYKRQPHGRSGKTTVTLGLLAALKQKGYSIQPFKKGPDFIDPSWMTLVTGVSCRNLDPFFMSKELIRHSFCLHGAQKSIAVVEGAMGLFDGVDIQGSGSTAEIAKIIEAPVILVVDSTRMTRSVAPLVNGFLHFDTEVTIAGVILNKVARSRHETMLRQAIETYCGIPVLGVLPKGKGLTIPDRHLGLIPAGAVSYTHLDVYKRQVTGWLFLEGSNFN